MPVGLVLSAAGSAGQLFTHSPVSTDDWVEILLTEAMVLVVVAMLMVLIMMGWWRL